MLRHTHIEGRHTLTFDIVGAWGDDATRVVDVYATEAEIEQLGTQGYLVRERLFPHEDLERLRDAMDAVEEDEIRPENIGRGENFGGAFPRHLMDKHETFLDLVQFAPTLSVARAVLGPYVNIRQLGARISYPGEPNQQTHWHIHRRHVPDPEPAFYVYPHTIDCLIYLDDTDDASGPLAILPGSHLGTHDHIQRGDLTEKPEQLTLRLPAGSCVIMHSNIWHRAYPTTPQGTKRRLLILCYGPTWMRRSSFGVRPADGFLSKMLAETDDPEVRELLGVGGYQ